MKQKSILCYGDSNTWGYVPTATHDKKMRYPRHIRWPGLVQTMLGSDFYIIEEGLNSRTTNINHTKPPDRNGKNYLAPCLYSHAPLDLVIVDLGGNDYKSYFNRTPEMIRDGMAELINIILSSPYGSDLVSAPQVLLVSPSAPLPIAETFTDENGVYLMANSIEKANALKPLYASLAKQTGCHYLDVNDQILPSGIDGVHLDEKGHHAFAELVVAKIKDIL